MTSVTDPLGDQTTYTYDHDGRNISLKDTSGNATTFAYDAAGRMTSETNPLGFTQSHTYDATGNRTNTGHTTGGNNELLSDGTYNYAYDANGNRISRTDIASGAATLYTYDDRNRLTQVVFKDGTGTVQKTVDYTYDLANQLIGEEVIAGSSDTVSRYVYDGGLTPQAAGGIVGATNATAVNLAAQLATFATGASAAGNIVLSFDGSGNLQNRNLWGPQADQLFADETAVGNVLWPLADNENTIRDVVNATGAVQDHLVYDAFGNITSQTNASQQPQYTYTGQMLDPATGLMYYKSRWYNPADGRFITQDPKTFTAGDVNLQRYVNNDPLRSVDPTGLAQLPLPGLSAAAIGGVFSPMADETPGGAYVDEPPGHAKVTDHKPFPWPVTRALGSGVYEPDYPDGTVMWQDPGGWITVQYPNGTYEQYNTNTGKGTIKTPPQGPPKHGPALPPYMGPESPEGEAEGESGIVNLKRDLDGFPVPGEGANVPGTGGKLKFQGDASGGPGLDYNLWLHGIHRTGWKFRRPWVRKSPSGN